MEQPAGRGRVFRGILRQSHGPRSEHLDPDALQRMGERAGQPGMADPQGRLHALRGSRLPQGLPGAGRDRAVRQRHRRLHQRELHRLRLLRQRLSVRHPAHQPGRSQIVQMHLVLGPGRRRAGAGLRQGVPDRGDHVRLEGRHDGVGGRARRRPPVARLQECRAVRPGGRRRHACDVCPAPCRPAVPLCRPAGQTAHQSLRRGVEGDPEAAGAGRHRRHGARRVLPLGRRRAQRGAVEDEAEAQRLLREAGDRR